ncbi:hypothetical protein [Streptacidiphilus jiangxiensis]|uniref:Uncharacterized protein n=1 Tax=Streptacidiphilus jiangxiensis TaxID=235985 RepID=A0A1H7FWB0_STRJI|nr:hypothetical protein [Streptacidiphilus jiangxiensis]SEK30201.1 hypothetical protein SAMN05414137_101429 [Streptacidiphilus jiangxiensis]
MISMTKLAGRTVTVADFGMRGFGMRGFGLPCGKASGLSFAGTGVEATRVRVAAEATVASDAFAALAGNGLGAWDARRLERPLSASVVKLSALAGGYGDATGAGTQTKQQPQQHQLHMQKIAAAAMTIQALRGPDPWIDRT